MITVSYLGDSYACTTAIKGTDFIHLLDENDAAIACFDGVSDFTDFTITGGSWTTPSACDNCYLATIREDGFIDKSSKKLADLAPATGEFISGANTAAYKTAVGSTADLTPQFRNVIITTDTDPDISALAVGDIIFVVES